MALAMAGGGTRTEIRSPLPLPTAAAPRRNRSYPPPNVSGAVSRKAKWRGGIDDRVAAADPILPLVECPIDDLPPRCRTPAAVVPRVPSSRDSQVGFAG